MNSKARSGVKWLALVIGVLLLFLAVMGPERWAGRSDRFPQDGARRQSRDVPPAARVKPVRMEAQRSADLAPAVSDAPAEVLPELSSGGGAAPENRRNGKGGRATSGRLPSAIYFIRSHAILKGHTDKQSLVEAIGMMQQAVAKVGASLPPEAVIFDRDGFSTSQVSFVVHAKPEYDLSDEVVSVYKELKQQQQKLEEGGQTGR